MESNLDFLKVLDNCLEYLRLNYVSYHFYCERDFVWTIQKYIKEYLEKNKLPFKILNDFSVEPGRGRSKSVDLAIISDDLQYSDVLNGKAQAELLMEFKFEPSKMRKELFLKEKGGDVTSWNLIEKDIHRVKRFFENKLTKSSVAILVDEFSRHKKNRKLTEKSNWREWGSYNSEKFNVVILYTEYK